MKQEQAMALKKQVLTRVFNYAGVRLPDPDPTMSLADVRNFFASTGRPELTSAEVRGPDVVGTEQVYTLHRVTGTKGAPVHCTPFARSTKAQTKAAKAGLQRLDRKHESAAFDLGTSGPAVTHLAANKGASPVFLPSSAVRWIA